MQLRLVGGWDKYIRKLSPVSQAKIRRASDLATRINALYMVREIRKRITAGNYIDNAEMTVEIKDSSKPLVDSGRLFQAVTHRRIAPSVYFVGVLRTSKAYNTALIVHQGAEITVTTKMEQMFFLLWLVTTGKMNISDLKSERARALARKAKKSGGTIIPISGGTIHIPERKFIHEPFLDPALRAKMKLFWNSMIARALRAA